MVIVNFHLEKYDYLLFQQKVGKGNVSSSLRQYVLSCIEKIDDKSENEKILRKKLEKIQKEKRKIDSEFSKLKSKVNLIDQKREIEEQKRLEKLAKEKEKINKIEHDTIKTHLADMIK